VLLLRGEPFLCHAPRPSLRASSLVPSASTRAPAQHLQAAPASLVSPLVFTASLLAGLLLNNLSVYRGCEIAFDSSDIPYPCAAQDAAHPNAEDLEVRSCWPLGGNCSAREHIDERQGWPAT
jgi:hypothetical protein